MAHSDDDDVDDANELDDFDDLFDTGINGDNSEHDENGDNDDNGSDIDDDTSDTSDEESNADVDADADGDADADADGDADGDVDVDAEGEDDEGNELALEAALEQEMQEYISGPDAMAGQTPTIATETSSETSQIQPSIPAKPATSRPRSASPAQARREKLRFSVAGGKVLPRSYIVEAICAIPHPVPIHALASSQCMTHLITGSDDGIVRDYDIFAAVNGKTFLTAPQRQHCGVVEGIMKAGHLRYWWEVLDQLPEVDAPCSPILSLAMHSDALWALSGSQQGRISLCTVRHDPGRQAHVFNIEHKGPISALCIDHDEKGFFSGGWDGNAIQWDLNTGLLVRNFAAYGAQLVSAAVRPANIVQLPSVDVDQDMKSPTPTAVEPPSKPEVSGTAEMDTKSDASFDPLFDDEEDASLFGGPPPPSAVLDLPGSGFSAGPIPARPRPALAAAPKNAPPLFNSTSASSFSSDILMTAYIDGQILLWDRRVNSPSSGVARLWMSEKAPPWCLSACWSADGMQVYAGRRNGTIDIWDVRSLGKTGVTETPKLVKTLRNPTSSGVVSCVVAFPDTRHIACASVDNLRLWNVAEAGEPDGSMKPKTGVQFKIIPGHHGGYISQMLVDSGSRFLVSASSNRGWPYGDSTRTVFVHDIKAVQ